ncbi:MAG: ATP-binding protein, partial [Mycobacteriales bacterium]
MTDVITDAPLVGREQVLAELGAVLDRARQGHGGLVLVSGEAGLGKTRVAEELSRTAVGFAAHWAWCRVEQTAGSLRTWSTLLRALAAGTAAVSERAASSPPLRALVAGTGGAALDPEVARAQLAGEVTEALRLAAATTPRLLVLDDLHDAQPSSLRLLADLAAELRGLPVVLLATARDTGWEGRELVRAELLGQAHHLPLQPLGPEDVRALLPGAGSAQVQEVLERTGGNALLVTEVARGGAQVPPSLRAIVA